MRTTNHGISWDSISSVSSATSYIGVDATNSYTLYVAAPFFDAGNSIFRSTDGGITFTMVFLGTTYPVRIIENDPQDSSTIYVGVSPAALRRTRNHGGSWDTLAGQSQWGGVRLTSLAIARSDNRILYVGHIGHVFKSTDRGESWAELNLGFSFQSIVRLAVDPRDANVVYAGVYTSGSLPGGIYKSTDGGVSWLEKNVGLSLDRRQVYDLKINPKNPQELILGMFYADTAVYRSTNGAESWESFSSGLSPWQVIVQSIAIDTTNNQIYLCVSGPTGMYILDRSTNVPSESDAGSYFSIESFPNPCTGPTSVQFEIPVSGFASVSIFDIAGRKIREIVSGHLSKGVHRADFDAQSLPSGVYFCSLFFESKMRFTQKILVLR